MANVRNDDDDLFTIVMMAMGSLGVILAFAAVLAASMWNQSVDWLLEHHILVTSTDRPWITLPHTSGTGLDAQRCFVAAGALLLGLFVLVDITRRRWAKTREL